MAYSNKTIQLDETTNMKEKINNLAKELSIVKQLKMHEVYC